MKRNLKIFSVMGLSLFSIALLTGCDSGGTKNNLIETINISGENSVIIGSTIQLTAEYTPIEATNLPIIWSSSDNEIAMIDETGLLTGIKVGNSTITAQAGDVKDEFVVSVVYDKDKRTNLYVSDVSKLKVTQFADLHFGDPSKNYHNGKVEETYAYMDYLVDVEKPNLIVCSGDNILSTGTSGLATFISKMETYKTPWTFIYGNHDAESTTGASSKKSLHEYLLKAMKSTTYLIYKDGYVDTDNNRYGNFSIKVYDQSTKDVSLTSAFILMDSGTYNYETAAYDSITTGQISWYEKEVMALDEEYNKTTVIPSTLFQHIQLPEFYTAYNEAKAKTNGTTFRIEQDLTSSEIEEIRGGGPITDSGFFSKINELKSTKQIFVGHAHNYYFQMDYQGITLGFGPQTGHANIFPKDDDPRNTFTYIFDKDMNFTTSNTKEPYLKLGAASATIAENDTYDLTYELTNIAGDLKITSNNDEIASFVVSDGVISITPKKSGKFILSFSLDSGYKLAKTFVLNIREVATYNLFSDTNENRGTYNGLYGAVDQMFVDQMNTGSHINKTNSNDSSFVYDSKYAYNYVTKDGNYYGFEDNENVNEAKSKWWSTYVKDLAIYTQNNTSLLNTSLTSTEFGWQVRQTDFDVTNTDNSGGFQDSNGGNPNENWAGWQASIYKPGISVAQYVGWADNAAGSLAPEQLRNNFKFEYDLSNSTMKPSQNNNQPTIGDLWVGSSYVPVVDSTSGKLVPYLTGVTFNAGTVDSTKDLEDGAKCNMKLFYEELSLVNGLTSVTKKERTYGEEVGAATWNKTKGVWEFDNTLMINMNIVTDMTSPFSITTTASYGDKTSELVTTFDKVMKASEFRLTYGVNYTPDISTNNRKINDITCGGYWKNVVQKSASAYYNNTYLRDIGFMKGRVVNGARQIGIYGSDVCSVTLNNENQPVFNFIY
jgi:hypothetical protein